MFISASTTGVPLPEVDGINAILIPDQGTSVKLSWNRPKDSRKVTWNYGIYYGLDNNELFERSVLNTTNLTATVTKLQACEYYIFSVGIVGPYGLGPVSRHLSPVRTHMNKRAPPKNLRIERDSTDPLVIYVKCSPSCASERTPVDYVVSAFKTIEVLILNLEVE